MRRSDVSMPDRARVTRNDRSANAERRDLPRFLGDPFVRTELSGPRRIHRDKPRAIESHYALVLPSTWTIVSASSIQVLRGWIARPIRPLSTLRVRRHRRPRKTRFRHEGPSLLAGGTFTLGSRFEVSGRYLLYLRPGLPGAPSTTSTGATAAVQSLFFRIGRRDSQHLPASCDPPGQRCDSAMLAKCGTRKTAASRRHGSSGPQQSRHCKA